MRYLNMKGWLIVALTSLTVSACSNDKDEAANEWNSTYVYLQRNDYLITNVKTFNLAHDAQGITGDDINIVFTANAQKPVAKDVVVELGIISNSENLDVSEISLSSKTATIKAGEQVSEEITLQIDRNIFSTIEDKFSYSFSILINAISTENENTVISSNIGKFSATINKTAFLNLKSGTPANSKLWTAKTEWGFAFQDGVENPTSNSVAGTGSSDIATNGVPFWLTVDLQTVKTVKGIQTKHWASSYAPRQIEIFTSSNGSTWKSMGILATSGGTQNITFIAPVQTRYLKYQMLTVPSRVDMTAFYVYVPND